MNREGGWGRGRLVPSSPSSLVAAGRAHPLGKRGPINRIDRIEGSEPVTISPFDAWVLNRLLGSNQPWPREEFCKMSEFWLEVAYSLLVLEPSVRQAEWDKWLARQDDRDEILAMMAKVPPDQHAPPVNATDWPPPEPYRLLCAESIQAKPVEWLWRGRVPLGMITLFAGDPKLGKSYAALALAAAVSRGTPLPDSGPLDRPASVIIMQARRTIRPAPSCPGSRPPAPTAPRSTSSTPCSSTKAARPSPA